MPSLPLLILADDLSGAADCAAGFARVGVDSAIWLDAMSCQATPPATVLTIDTDSRRDDAGTTATKATTAWRRHGAGRRLFKKIDSTLRGGWVAEVAALQPLLGMALVAPAFPAMGRTLRDGVLLVDGTPLAQTATWRLEHAGHESAPLRMLQHAGLVCEAVRAELLEGPADGLREHVRLARARGCQALVFDAADATQLRALAVATGDMQEVFWVGSAGLSREMAEAVAVPPRSAAAGIDAARSATGYGVLTVVGSLSDVARRQVACLEASAGTRVHRLGAADLRDRPAGDANPAPWALAIGAELSLGLDPVLCIEAGDNADPAEGPLLARHLGRHLATALDSAAGLVLTGGETARAMLAQLGITRLQVLDEVEPGVVLSGSVCGRGRTIATKAGAFGDAGSLERARQAVRARIAATATATTPVFDTSHCPPERIPMSAYVPVIGITMGDAAGIGPEIIAKSFANHDLSRLARAVVIGDAGRLRQVRDLLGLDLDIRAIATVEEARFDSRVLNCIDLALIPPEMPFGKLSAVAGDAAFRFIEKAVQMAKAGEIDAICTAPLNKEALHAGGHKFPGHTEMLAKLTGVEEVSMMLVAPNLRVIHVTTHIGIIDAIRKIEPGLVLRTIERGYQTLRKANIDNPRIAVCGINPHAGENGLFGYGEEAEKIEPAIRELRARGLDIEGPLPADTLFFRAGRGDFDLVVAMYHDQGHGPVKVMGLESGVNITVGLDVIRTSVDHGTAFDIAGKGIADERSLLEALRQGAELATHR